MAMLRGWNEENEPQRRRWRRAVPEPFLQAKFIGEPSKYCKLGKDLGFDSCFVVNNGSKVTEKWMNTYGEYLDFMAISIDSFKPETNIQLGRPDKLL